MFRVLLLALLVLAAVVVIRTIAYRSVVDEVLPADPVTVDDARILERLQQAIAIQTVSPQPPERADPLAFDAFLDWLETTYPQVFAALDATRLGGHSLLLTWRGGRVADAVPAGTAPARTAPAGTAPAGTAPAGTGPTAVAPTDTPRPVLLAAHYDVVPVIAGSERLWRFPAFSGRIADGHVWGRGALDNKNAVVGLMEAVDWLLERGEQPTRTVYFSFGHDEELGGSAGAAAVVEHLREAGVRLAWTLDEGSFVFRDMFPGVTVPVATINTAEKGSVTLNIVASAAGGHSSMPPQETAVGRLAEALVALQGQPLPGGLEGLAAESFDAIGPHMPWLPRSMFANRWLFGPLVESQLSQLPFANAMLRTTTAPTMLQGSPKVNVLPIEAVATVNFRIHPRDTVADVVRHVERLVSSDQVRVEAQPGRPASAVADAASEGFRLVEAAVRAEFGELVVAPGLLVAATDSRHYAEIADNAFRFNPMVVTQAEIDGFHGTNERISSAGMVKGVRTYVRLLRSL